MMKKINDQSFLDVIKGGGINFIFYGLNLLIVYFLALFISKVYSAEVYGRYSIIKSLILVLIILATFGLNTLSIKLSSNSNFYEKGVFKADYLKKSYLLLFFASILISAIVFFGKSFIALRVFNDKELIKYFEFFPLFFIASVFLNYNSNTFKGQGKILAFSITSSFLTNFLFFVSLLFLYQFFTSSELTLIKVLSFSFIITLIVSSKYMFPIKQTESLNKIPLRELLKDSLPMMLSSSMIFIIFSIDILMLGMFETSQNVGVYKVVSQIASINTILIIVFGTVVGPKISNFYSENKIKELKQLLQKTLKLVFILTFPIFLILIIFSDTILLFFGESYSIGKQSLIILCICQFLYALSGFVDLTLNMTGNQKIFGKITLFTALLNLLLNFVLIPRLGINGAAIATGLSILTTNFASAIYIKKKLNIISVYIPFIKK